MPTSEQSVRINQDGYTAVSANGRLAAPRSDSPSFPPGASWGLGVSDLNLTLAAIALFAGMSVLVGQFSWDVVPCSLTEGQAGATSRCLGGSAMKVVAVGGILILLALVVGGLALRAPNGSPGGAGLDAGTVEYNSRLYGYTLVGLGYALLLIATLNMIAFAGFARAGYIDVLFPGTDETDAAAKRELYQLIRLLVSMGMAQLGALFFVTNAMRRKRDTGETYDTRKFWGGLWYRLGEAVLFTLVFFLAFRFYGSRTGDRFLPLVALCLGMFVTTGEALVFGLVQRVLKGAIALVGNSQPLRSWSTTDVRRGAQGWTGNSVGDRGRAAGQKLPRPPRKK